jgi:tetratricopeptide (TPR) repeat protein
MTTWNEWDRLVREFQTGNDRALENILQNSRGIVEGVVSQTMHMYLKTNEFVLDSDDIFQKVSAKVPQELMKIKKPSYYPLWLKRVAKNFCLRELSKIKHYIQLAAIDKAETRSGFEDGKWDTREDLKGLEASSLWMFQDYERDFIEQNYEDKAIGEILKTQMEGAPKVDDFKPLEWLTIILGKALVDKAEYNYPDAEKKLRAIIKFTEKTRQNSGLKYLRAKALFELGHLKMNEGFTKGSDGSIFYYNTARQIWQDLKDKPNLLYTVQQTGVSHNIHNDSSRAHDIYKSILDEVPKNKIFREIKTNVLCNLSSAYLALGSVREADKVLEKCLEYAVDIGGKCLDFAKLQKAKIHSIRRQYSKSYQIVAEILKKTPPYEVLDHVKAYIVLFDLYMADNQKDNALSLASFIAEKCKTHLFNHQLKIFNNLRTKYQLH